MDRQMTERQTVTTNNTIFDSTQSTAINHWAALQLKPYAPQQRTTIN